MKRRSLLASVLSLVPASWMARFRPKGKSAGTFTFLVGGEVKGVYEAEVIKIPVSGDVRILLHPRDG